MSNTLDLLLKIDKKKLVRPTKQVEIKRLSEITGEKVLFTLQALTWDEKEEIAETAVTKGEYDSALAQVLTIVKCIVDPNLKDKKLMDDFGVVTPQDLIEKSGLLLVGEVQTLYSEITSLSGFGDDAVAEIKNV